MRVAVLPREVAARVITSGIARGVWAVNAMNLALTVPILVEFMLMRDLASQLFAPLVILLALLVFAVVAALNPHPWVVVAFLVVGSIGVVLYEVTLITLIPDVLSEAYFLVNRPAVSLVLVGVASSTWRAGLVWTGIGYLVSTGASAVAAAIAATPFRTGWAPLLMFTLYVSSYLAFAAIQANVRRRVPNFEEFEEETRRMVLEENLRSRATALVHDTLLNDLSIVMTAPDELDERARARLREDIDTLRSEEWLTHSAQTPVDDQDGELRNQLMMIVSDLQWRGLTVHITGSGSGIYRLEPEVADALLEATRVCLENVLRHSGASVAKIDLAYTHDELTLIVSDQGRGFDPTTVAADRLGIRVSLVTRIEAVGGDVKIWSSPEVGTSIVIRVPVAEMVTPHEESPHAHS